MGSSLLPPYRKPLVPGSCLKQSALPWITAPGAASLRSDFTGWVGGMFTADENFTITHLGRFWYTGNSGSVDVGLFEVDGDPIEIVTVDLSSGVNLETNWAPLVTPFAVSVTDQIIIASLEANGGNEWRDENTPTTTAVAAVNSRQFRAGTGTSGAFSGNPGTGLFVPPNFKYTL